MHVSIESTVPDHCRKYALSDSGDVDYKSDCDHNHTDSCDRCDLLSNVLVEIEEAASKTNDHSISEDTIDEIQFTIKQAKQNIIAWKAHLLRSINQDDARLDVIEDLDDTTVWLVEDWAMKFIPRKYRESQRDWFGKRGLSWHITVATRRSPSTKELEMMTFTHVFQSCSQDSHAVLAIMSDVINKLKQIMPSLKTIVYRQDNAGCYRSGPTIVGASLLSQLHGVTIKRLDFSDPQGGKGACDRKAANIKTHMKVYLNQGNDIETAQQMVAAMKSSTGIHGVDVALCESVTVPTNVINVKLNGVSSISNVEYNLGYLRIWKAYGIGPGKKIQLDSLNFSGNLVLPTLNVSSSCESVRDQFSSVHKKSKREKTPVEPGNTEVDTSDESSSYESTSKLFACPEEGCTMTYQRFSALQHHLDNGKHQRTIEHETLYDKAAHGYTVRLE